MNNVNERPLRVLTGREGCTGQLAIPPLCCCIAQARPVASRLLRSNRLLLSTASAAEARIAARATEKWRRCVRYLTASVLAVKSPPFLAQV